MRIVEILKERREVRVSSLSEDLGVSEMTIRRDLERLETEGVLLRTHGGAILKRHMVEEPRYVENVVAHTEEKERIAKTAAAMIQPGETVFLSNGTTAARVLRHVDPGLRARVITYNVGALAEAQGLRLELILLGGFYRPRTNTVEGPQTLENLERFHAAKTFIGADGFDLEEGVTTPSVTIASIERAMIDHTRGDVVVLADRSKIGVVADVVICRVDQVDVVVVDDGLEVSAREEMERAGLRCVVT
ncbi:MAG TPA: DeoR/GlpR family DNA-binding transcription regulator [Thermoleophilia bacterium]|nr:DeoR/GlpR family DNA-binding transcription regulator [Thermoleophilia bacterium]